MLALIGQKKTQSQRFLENGRRIPVTLIDVKNNTVISVRINDTHNYQAVQLGISAKKKANKAEVGHAKGAKLEKAPKFLKEVRINDESENMPEVGTVLNPAEVFAPGDIVDVSGVSKGKGYAGVVKRHHFRGGPKTHGQSDRHRAPGAIGQGTTPGRVYRGKRMAGRMGNENVTVENLEIMEVTNDGVLVIKGLVPGITNGLIVVKKVGTDAKFVPLQKTPEQLEAEEKARLEEEAAAASSSAKATDGQESTEEAEAETVEAATAEETTSEESTEEIKAETSDEAVETTEESKETTDEKVEEKGANSDETTSEDSKEVKEEENANN